MRGVARVCPTQEFKSTIHQAPGRRKPGTSPRLQTPIELPFKPQDEHLCIAKQCSVASHHLIPGYVLGFIFNSQRAYKCIFLKTRKQPSLKEFQASILRERESAGSF